MEEQETAFITKPKGFKANGVAAGMKSNPANVNPSGEPNTYLDIAMVYSEEPCSVAGVYTSNLVKGHSLTRSIDIIESGKKVRGIVINSKNANAGVGPLGVEDAVQLLYLAVLLTRSLQLPRE